MGQDRGRLRGVSADKAGVHGTVSPPGSGLASATGLDEWDRRIAKLNLPGYKLVGKLGAGGMGRVYKARQTSLARDVAIKVLDPSLVSVVGFRELFMKEAQVLAKLRHPGIVSVLDAGEVEGMLYLAMEYVDGVTLRRLMANRDLTPSQVVALGMEICEAVGAAHRCGVVHRDLKPENVIVSRNGIVKVMDFGVAATLSEAGGEPQQFMGTRIYASPEQAKGMPVDARADVYALGVMLYEMLSLSLPNKDAVPPSQVNRNCPRWLDKIVVSAIATDPSMRPESALALLAALRHGEAKAKRLAIESEFAHKAMLQMGPPPRRSWLSVWFQCQAVFSRVLGGLACVAFGWSLMVPYFTGVSDNVAWDRSFQDAQQLRLSVMACISALSGLSFSSAFVRSDVGRSLLQLLLSAGGVLLMGSVLKVTHASSGWDWMTISRQLGLGSHLYWGSVGALLLGSLASAHGVQKLIILVLWSGAAGLLLYGSLVVLH